MLAFKAKKLVYKPSNIAKSAVLNLKEEFFLNNITCFAIGKST